MALPHDATGVSAVCDCGISRSYSLIISDFWQKKIVRGLEYEKYQPFTDEQEEVLPNQRNQC